MMEGGARQALPDNSAYSVVVLVVFEFFPVHRGSLSSAGCRVLRAHEFPATALRWES